VFVFLFSLWLCPPIDAQENVLDNTGAHFLTIDPFARSAGMGGAFTGVTGGIGSLHFNPGGLALCEGDIISSTHCEWFQGMRFENLALSHSMGSKGALGVVAKGFYTTGLEKRTADTREPEGMFGAYFIDFGATYAKQLLYFLPVGLSLKGVYEKIDENAALGFCIDFGLLYLTNIEGLQFGFALRNIGSEMTFKKEEFTLPGAIGVGATYRTLGGNLLLCADIEKIGKRKATVDIGCEVLILKTLSLRFGANGETRDDLKSSTAGLSVGAGFAVGDVKVDYAFVNYDYLGMTHRFGLTFTPGVTESEREHIRKLALEEARKSMIEKERMMSLMYLEKGEELIAEGKYDEAITSLDIALIWNPTSAKAKERIQQAEDAKRRKEETDAFDTGRKAFETGNLIEAIAQLDRVIELNPDNQEAQNLRNEAKSRIEEESRKLAQKQKEKSEDIQSLFSNAVKEYSRGNYRIAISKWQKVLNFDPTRNDARSYIDKANRKLLDRVASLESTLKIQVSKKDWLGVVSTANNIKSLDPSNQVAVSSEKKAKVEISALVQANLKKAKEYYQKGNMFSSEEYFRIVLRYDPGNAKAKSYIKKIERGGKHEDADKWYLKGIDAYIKHQYKLAISYWNRCLTIDPEYEKAKKNMERARKKLVELGESP